MCLQGSGRRTIRVLVQSERSQHALSTQRRPDGRAAVITLFRQCDSRFAFLWASARQPEGRWHAPGDGPVQYLANSPDGAWAELLRHEEIDEIDDLEGIARALWAVELPEVPSARPNLDDATVHGDRARTACQVKPSGFVSWERGLVAPSAALRGGEVRRGERSAKRTSRPANTLRRWSCSSSAPDLDGWLMVDRGAPPSHVLADVRHFES
jgi:hypothetical protein